MKKSIAIMQPYIFPYIGYFQLLKEVENFVILDDVNYIKKGWINRNRILINSEPNFFCFPIKKISQNKKINELHFDNFKYYKTKFLKQIKYAYSCSSEFKNRYEFFLQLLEFENDKVIDFTVYTIKEIINLFEFKANVHLSSELQLKSINREDKIIEIVKRFDSNTYINLPNGRNLYDKNYFKNNNINLLFLERNDNIKYKQFNEMFCKDLSIIDCMMFNDNLSLNKIFDCFHVS